MCNEVTDIQFLERTREAHNLTIVAFTSRLPIQRSTYYNWIRGRRKPDPYRMRACLKIARKMK